MQSTTRVYINGRRWTIERGPVPRDSLGTCNWDTRTIRLAPSLVGVDLLDVLLHELAHARFPDLAEAAVEDFATTAAHLADRAGFRHPDHEED
jgi:hypothetical protein